jgi:hypothetical protein
MKAFKIFASLLCLAVVGLLALPKASADEWNKKTQMTFTDPVEVPGGVVLPPGTYIFVLVDSVSDRHIVRIWNQDQSKVVATILAINNYRLTPTDQTVVTFNERPSGTPETIHAWFYPGNSFGQEFVYPKDRAMQLAVANKIPVLATRTELPADVTSLKEVPVIAVTPDQTEEPVAAAVQAAPTTEAVAEPPATAPKMLPKTASSIPIVLALGMFCLMIGFTLWRFAKTPATTSRK